MSLTFSQVCVIFKPMKLEEVMKLKEAKESSKEKFLHPHCSGGLEGLSSA